jgi:hypothetical protein
MKCFNAVPAAVVLGLAACNDMSRPITNGDFDPLSTPGGQVTPVVNTQAFAAGQFVRAIMDNTAFFKNRPKGEADADKLLVRGTSMKVISTSDTYVKVELDSGEVGWVPVVMVEDPNAVPAQEEAFGTPNPGEYQVYPPVGGYGGMLPPVTPAELPPEGAIPTVIDPEAPASPDPVPPVTVPGDTFPAPPSADGAQ